MGLVTSCRTPPKSSNRIEVSLGPIELHRDTELDGSFENPGLGGTEFSTILLAIRLANLIPEARIKIGIVGKNLSGLEKFTNIEIDFWESWDSVAVSSAVAFTPLQSLESLFPSQIRCDSLVVIVHHPSDPQIRAVRKTFRPNLFAHVGEYSFWSNFSLLSPTIFLPNTILSPILPVRRFRDQPVRVGYLGALVRPKRFHELASAWKTIHLKHPRAHLEVIGGASLYGDHETHPLIPTSREYGDEILDAFGSPRNLSPSGVTFLGNVTSGKNEIISHWTAGVINPTGNTESYAYSAREILRLGVPVIAGRRQGLSELMCHFPQFRISRRNNLANLICSIGEEGIDFEKFETQRQRWLSGESKVNARVDGVLPKLIIRLVDGRPLRTLQLKMWPSPRVAIVSALLLELTLTIEHRLRRFANFLYASLRNLKV